MAEIAPESQDLAFTLAPKDVPQTSDFIATLRSLHSTTVQPDGEGIVTKIFVKLKFADFSRTTAERVDVLGRHLVSSSRAVRTFRASRAFSVDTNAPLGATPMDRTTNRKAAFWARNTPMIASRTFSLKWTRHISGATTKRSCLRPWQR